MNEFGEVLENVDLKKYNTYRIGGKTKYLIKPYDINSLQDLLNYLSNNNFNYYILGKGSNVILPDEDYDGVIILLDKLNKVFFNNSLVEVEAGISLSEFVNKCINNNLGGLENLMGIPGTLGAGIVGNVGCYGNTISDYLVRVTCLENGVLKVFDKVDCKFSYRSSLFKENKNLIVLKVTFNLFNSNKDDMLKIVHENLKKRHHTQPLEFPNAGSVFKNPEGFAAGKLIEDLGLKNMNVNDAYVSEKHANFIINKANAKAEDIINLINIIKEKVNKEYGIELVLEQIIVKY